MQMGKCMSLESALLDIHILLRSNELHVKGSLDAHTGLIYKDWPNRVARSFLVLVII